MIHKNIENTLIKQNPHWKSVQEKSQYIKRDFLRNINLNSKFIEIIVGVRRGGKSTAFKIFIDSLIQQKKAKAREILFLNFDNPNFTSLYDNVGDLDLLIEQAEVLTGYKIKYLFLDEIQNINLWEKWVKAAYDQNDFKKIFITGSNSSLLESKYISLLSGRHFSYINFPFSFKEFLAAKKISLADDKIDILRNKHNILKLFDQYLKLGGFPEVVIDKDVNIINSYNSDWEAIVKLDKHAFELYEQKWFEAIDKIKQMQLVESEYFINEALINGEKILAEGAQGTLLTSFQLDRQCRKDPEFLLLQY